VNPYILERRHGKVAGADALCKGPGPLRVHPNRIFEVGLGADQQQLDVVANRCLNVPVKIGEPAR
jgi:hypothetical protein